MLWAAETEVRSTKRQALVGKFSASLRFSLVKLDSVLKHFRRCRITIDNRIIYSVFQATESVYNTIIRRVAPVLRRKD